MDSTETATKEIYDHKSFDPKRSIGGLLGRVKVEMSAALDAELEPLHCRKRIRRLDYARASPTILAR